MQDPSREVGSLCRAMLNPAQQQNAAAKYLTDDVQLIHFQVWIKGRRAFLNAYQLWGWLNRGQASFDIDYVAYSSKDKLTVRGHTNTHLILLPRFRLEFFIELHLTGEPGAVRIKQQHDHLLVLETCVYQLPIVGVIFEKYLPQLTGSLLFVSLQLLGSFQNWLGQKTSISESSVAEHPLQYVRTGNFWPVPKEPQP